MNNMMERTTKADFNVQVFCSSFLLHRFLKLDYHIYWFHLAACFPVTTLEIASFYYGLIETLNVFLYSCRVVLEKHLIFVYLLELLETKPMIKNVIENLVKRLIS